MAAFLGFLAQSTPLVRGDHLLLPYKVARGAAYIRMFSVVATRARRTN
jgi:hypothetical protein